MVDREKVIKAIEYCFNIDDPCEQCPYDGIDCISKMKADALALLKEQPEIIRCKDCIFGEHERNNGTGMEWIYCKHHRENRPKEWFCASGSRTI